MTTENESDKTFPNWQASIWRIVVIGFGICVLLFIIYACYMLHAQLTLLLISAKAESRAAIAGTGILGAQFLRGLSILIGGAVIFGGLSISFFSGSDINSFSRGGDNDIGRVSISTKTPGIIGILVGGLIIIYAVRATYHYEYVIPDSKPKDVQTSVPPNDKPQQNPTSTK